MYQNITVIIQLGQEKMLKTVTVYMCQVTVRDVIESRNVDRIVQVGKGFIVSSNLHFRHDDHDVKQK